MRNTRKIRKPRKKCSDMFRSKKTQGIFNRAWKKTMDATLKEFGGLPHHAFLHFRNDFKRGFMETCKKTNRPL
jgi:hypothetical protein